jgi:hypothetical protein
MQWAKEKGFGIYDLGGIGFDDSSEEVKRIDAFKRRLGGYDVKLLNQYERIMYFPSIANRIRETILKMRQPLPKRSALAEDT